MRVLGIDPGSRLLGWGIVDGAGNRFSHVDSGVVRASGADLSARLVQIADALDALIGCHQPEAIAVEDVFFAKNSQSALILGHARGVALLCAARSGAVVAEYTPGQVKQAVTGRGRADKTQVQHMVRLLLGLQSVFETMDQSDALAVALCHLQMQSSPIALALRQAAGGG